MSQFSEELLKAEVPLPTRLRTIPRSAISPRMRIAALVFLISLLGACFAERVVDDPRPFMGCYGTRSFAAKVDESSVWFSVPGQTFPSHVGEDKHGYYLLVEKPIRYERDDAGNLRLDFYNGSGTYFRFLQGHAALEVLVVNGIDHKLPKVSCDALNLS